MLTIRFHRTGRTNHPAFKIVVTDKTKSSTGGRFIEEVGFFNPATKEKILRAERMKYWLSVGAKPSPTVWNLLVQEKVIEGTKLPKHKTPKQSAGADATGQEPKKAKEAPAAAESVPEQPKP